MTRLQLLATLTITATLGMTGCIFPFSRDSAGALDAKLADSIAAAHADPARHPNSANAANQPLPKNSLNDQAPRPAIAGEETLAPSNSQKQMPPFARFIGNFFGGKSTPPAAAEELPIPSQDLGEALPTQSLAADLQPSATPQDPVLSSQAREMSSIAGSQNMPASQPEQTADSPVTQPQQPVEDSVSKRLPVVVAPATQPSSDLPIVESGPVEAKPTEVASLPKVVAKPTQPQTVDSAAPAPQISTEDLDATVKSPWQGSSLMQQAKKNSSTQSTTLTHALEIALDNFDTQPIIPEPATTESPNSQVAESALQPSAIEYPNGAATGNSNLVSPKPSTVQIPASAMASSDRSIANPLRTTQRTPLRPEAIPAEEPEPKLVENETIDSPATTSAKPPAREASDNQSTTLAATERNKPKASEDQPSREQPMTVENPYAKSEAARSDQTAPPLNETTIEKPLVASSKLAAPAAPTDSPSAAPEPIHFETSVLGKLKAVKQQASVSQAKPEADDANTQSAIELAWPDQRIAHQMQAKSTIPAYKIEQPALPKIVTGQDSGAELPQIASIETQVIPENTPEKSVEVSTPSLPTDMAASTLAEATPAKVMINPHVEQTPSSTNEDQSSDAVRQLQTAMASALGNAASSQPNPSPAEAEQDSQPTASPKEPAKLVPVVIGATKPSRPSSPEYVPVIQTRGDIKFPRRDGSKTYIIN